jgi:hypothetical protein
MGEGFAVNNYAIGFRWAVIVGILQDWFFGLPGIFIPNAVLGFAGADPVIQTEWPAFACLLLMLLSFFYLPAAADPFRYRSYAVLTVLARAGGVFLFFVLYAGRFPALMGYIDLTFTVVQGGLLFLALWAGPTIGPPSKEARV